MHAQPADQAPYATFTEYSAANSAPGIDAHGYLGHVQADGSPERVSRITVFTFSKWGGFTHEAYVIERAFPHTLVSEERETVVEYECGIVF